MADVVKALALVVEVERVPVRVPGGANENRTLEEAPCKYVLQ